jgi:hypothetical protein
MDVPFTDRRMEWQALFKERNNADGRLASFKERNNADGRLASRPKGSPLRPGSCIAMLDKGLPLPAHWAFTPGLSGLL